MYSRCYRAYIRPRWGWVVVVVVAAAVVVVVVVGI